MFVEISAYLQRRLLLRFPVILLLFLEGQDLEDRG